jgi:hypothetical protein
MISERLSVSCAHVLVTGGFKVILGQLLHLPPIRRAVINERGDVSGGEHYVIFERRKKRCIEEGLLDDFVDQSEALDRKDVRCEESAPLRRAQPHFGFRAD